MSLADIVLDLQQSDRYAGLGQLPKRELPSMPMAMPIPQRPTAQQQSSVNPGLLGLVMAAQQGRQGGGTGRGGGGMGMAPSNASGPISMANEIARRLERKGFQVSGLEGWQGTGQISSGHIDNSQHYTGHAGDVTYGGAGRWDNETAALNWAERMLQRRYGDALTELIWQEPGHWGHLHYGTRPGG